MPQFFIMDCGYVLTGHLEKILCTKAKPGGALQGNFAVDKKKPRQCEAFLKK
jgi:hypothetical protein